LDGGEPEVRTFFGLRSPLFVTLSGATTALDAYSKKYGVSRAEAVRVRLRDFSQSAGNRKWIFGTIQLSVPGKAVMWIPLSTKRNLRAE
jgi:hypothetical protein